MAKVMKKPLKSYPQYSSGKNFAAYDADVKRFWDELRDRLLSPQQEGLTGKYFRFVSPSGSTFYIIHKEKPLSLQWIPCGAPAHEQAAELSMKKIRELVNITTEVEKLLSNQTAVRAAKIAT
jgi:hypothetical protein